MSFHEFAVFRVIFYTLAVWSVAGAVMLFVLRPPVRKTACESAMS